MDQQRLKAIWLRAARMIAVLALCLAAGATSSVAEDAGGLNFFQKLFGLPAARPEPQPVPTPRRTPRRVDFVPATTTRAPGAPGGAPVQAKFHVEVIGDSLAGRAAEGLTEAFADKPEIGILDRTRDASGVVRTDYYDWAKFTKDNAAATDKPDFVVIMLGVNDGQLMRDGSEWLEALGDKWRDRYGERVENIVAPYVAAHIPVAWVGLPPLRAERANAFALKVNEIYRQHAEKAGAKFIDVFDAFADQNGQYDAFGPNVEGQTVKLRNSDGIHFTKAGSRKLANFLESEIRHTFDKHNPASEVAALPPDIEQAADDINAQIRREMGVPSVAPTPEAAGAPEGPPPRPLAGPILQLTARPTTPGGALLARSSDLPSELPETLRVLRVGEPTAPVAGRADDFAWTKL